MADPVPECLSCGVCCFSQLDRYVRVRGEDYERLGERAASLVVFFGTEAYMQMREGACGALESSDGQFFCSVYADRPAVCRELERGSQQCAGERHAKGDRPLILLQTRACQ